MSKAEYVYFQALGQDSHRFAADPLQPLMLGGVLIEGETGLEGNSDADVLLHSLVNSISGLSTVIILGPVADEMCRNGITDSKAYVAKALESLDGIELLHLSFTVEAGKPKLLPHIPAMRRAIADLTGLSYQAVAITATSGEGLTAFGCGEGIQAFCLASARRPA